MLPRAQWRRFPEIHVHMFLVPQRLLLKSLTTALSWRLQQLHHTYILQVGRKGPLSGAEEMLRVAVPSWWQLGSSICLWKRSRFIFIGRTQVFMALTEEHSQLCDCWDCPEKPESESVHMLHFY